MKDTNAICCPPDDGPIENRGRQLGGGGYARQMPSPVQPSVADSSSSGCVLYVYAQVLDSNYVTVQGTAAAQLALITHSRESRRNNSINPF